MESPHHNHRPTEKSNAADSTNSSSLTKHSDKAKLLDPVSQQLGRDFQARRGKGEVKGERISYGPCLDPKIENDMAQKRDRTSKYAQFGEKVRRQCRPGLTLQEEGYRI